MKTFRILGMALFAVLLSVNFVACGGSDDAPTEESPKNLSKIIIGTWEQDGDDDIIVVKSDGTFTWYYDEIDYKNGEVAEINTWKIKGKEWLYIYDDEGDLDWELFPAEVNEDLIIWKDYNDYGELSDSYGKYSRWRWTRYDK